MSREIKFRAWDKETKEMSYDFLSKNWLKVCVESPYIELMQYTGLKDQFGKEIYEGDIIDQHRDRCIIERCVGGFDCKMISGPHKGSTFVFSYLHAHSCQVIGNIYETPELKKEV